MSDQEVWLEMVRHKTNDFKERWLTRHEFECEVRNLLIEPSSPLHNLMFSFECSDPFTSFDIATRIGLDNIGGANATWELPLLDERPTICRIHLWKKPGLPLSQNRFDDPIEELVRAFWKPEMRTRVAGIPDLKRVSQATELVEKVLLSRPTGAPVALLHCDLDKFKTYNDKHGQARGDSAIRAFGVVVEDCAGRDGIVFHDGGDEFVLLHLSGSEVTALDLAWKIKTRVQKLQETLDGADFTASIGIACGVCGSGDWKFQDLALRAEKVLKNELKGEGRDRHHLQGSARFSEMPNAEPVEGQATDIGEWSLRTKVELAMCIVKSAAFDENPFKNPWLNHLSVQVAKVYSENGQLDQVRAEVTEFLDWVRPENGTELIHLAQFGYEQNALLTSATLSHLDCAFAIAHGLLHTLTHKTDFPALITVSYREAPIAAAVMLNGLPVWSSEEAAELPETVDFGLPVRLKEPLEITHGTSITTTGARATLVRIGHKTLSLPLCIFSEVIVVDDRPTSGGGLPDFWEIAITRLIANMIERPRVEAVYILGEKAHAVQTVAKLQAANEWIAHRDELIARLPVPSAHLEAVSKRLSGKVHVFSQEAELVRSLCEMLRDAQPFEPDHPHSSLESGSLPLRLDAKERSLQTNDGCRVATLADAYPTVLEIIRRTDEQTIRDQANQILRELIDFKVVLTQPTQHKVPAFFRTQEDQLDNYYQHSFMNPGKWFGQALRASNQLELVLNHVCGILNRPDEAVATRRAILVVPHIPMENGSVSPLGLVSVRIIPRFESEKILLHYSFTWRTVEALVGFPYSLHGSIRFAQWITGELCQRVEERLRARIQMGQLSYIAHSLHLFVDDYGLSIARRIVHEAAI